MVTRLPIHADSFEHFETIATTPRFTVTMTVPDHSRLTTIITIVMKRIQKLCDLHIRWFIGDFALTSQYFASSLSVNCHDRRFHRLPTISLHRVCQ